MAAAPASPAPPPQATTKPAPAPQSAPRAPEPPPSRFIVLRAYGSNLPEPVRAGDVERIVDFSLTANQQNRDGHYVQLSFRSGGVALFHGQALEVGRTIDACLTALDHAGLTH